MKITRRFAALALTLAMLTCTLTGCKSTITSMARKIIGTSDEVQEEDTTRWAESTDDQLNIEGISDASAKYASARVSTRLNVVFNGIWSRKTDYFTAPNGSITITAYGTADGTQKFKVAVWRKIDGGAEYVDGSTYYFKTDGQNYRCVVSGLDPSSSYRLTISYDSSKYYLSGALQVEGVG